MLLRGASDACRGISSADGMPEVWRSGASAIDSVCPCAEALELGAGRVCWSLAERCDLDGKGLEVFGIMYYRRREHSSARDLRLSLLRGAWRERLTAGCAGRDLGSET